MPAGKKLIRNGKQRIAPGQRAIQIEYGDPARRCRSLGGSVRGGGSLWISWVRPGDHGVIYIN